MNPAEVRIVFMGSPTFAVPSLRALHAAGYDLRGVITQPDRPAGRGRRLSRPPAKTVALELGLPVLQPESLKDEDIRESLRDLRPDLFVVAAYGKILPRAVLDIPARGSVNVHASILPRWRGASPIAAAILAGDPVTGVTIMEMAPHMDAGAVIATATIPIGPGDTTGSLEARLAGLGARTLIEVLLPWYNGTLVATSQDEAAATYCSLVSKSDGHLRAAMSAVEAERAVRAYNPWPGAFVLYRDRRLAIWAASVAPAGPPAPPGTLVVLDRKPAIYFGDAMLVLDQVQPAGSPRRSGVDFLNGERGLLPPSVELV